jgi:cytochrome c biogenesis protein CcmG, thiol:disulfide interchange protein DsbE
MSTYYTLLEVAPEASREEIEAAYQQQQQRYDPQRVAGIDEELRRIAEERIQELEQAYAVLSDPQQRQEYDAYIGVGQKMDDLSPHAQRSPISRELWFSLGGVAVALVVVIVLWMATNQSARNPATGSAPAVNRPAPAFNLPTPDGDTVSLDDYQGQVVMVNFWGSWCAPCINELPELQAAYEQLHPQGFTIIGINLYHNEQSQQKSQADIQNFVKQHNLTYPIALDTDGSVTRAYQVYPIPTSFFIDPDGNIRYILPSELNAEKITTLFHELKQEAAAMPR